MTESRLKLPDEYTELSYEDGELSGSGHRRWTSEDTKTVLKQVGIIGGICTVGAIWYFREPIGRGITNAWNYITGCCSPDHGDNVITIPNDLNNDIQNTNYNNKSGGQNNNNKSDGLNEIPNELNNDIQNMNNNNKSDGRNEIPNDLNNNGDGNNDLDGYILVNGIVLKQSFYDRVMAKYESDDPRWADGEIDREINRGRVTLEQMKTAFPQYKNYTEVPVSDDGSDLYKADNDKTGYVYSVHTSFDSNVDQNDPALWAVRDLNRMQPQYHHRLVYNQYEDRIELHDTVTTEEIERRREINRELNQIFNPKAPYTNNPVYHSTYGPWDKYPPGDDERPVVVNARSQLDVCLERAAHPKFGAAESGTWLNYQEEKLGYPREKILADYPDYQIWLKQHHKK